MKYVELCRYIKINEKQSVFHTYGVYVENICETTILLFILILKCVEYILFAIINKMLQKCFNV